jgi:hypothetical protein
MTNLKLSGTAKQFVRRLAREHGMTTEEAERGLSELIERGHVKIHPGAGPGGVDVLELIIKGARQ